jgi:hypothetical protein
MELHVIYQVGPHCTARRLLLAEASVRLANGEVKLPHGGLSLLVEVDSPSPDAFPLDGKQVRLAGRAVVRGGMHARAGWVTFRLAEKGRRRDCTLPVAFTAATALPRFRPFRGAWEVEFLARGPDHDPLAEIVDPELMEYREPGELSLGELVDLLGGPVGEPAGRFTAEGGIVA